MSGALENRASEPRIPCTGKLTNGRKQPQKAKQERAQSLAIAAFFSILLKLHRLTADRKTEVTALRKAARPTNRAFHRIPRRSPKVTHLCSDRVAHMKNSVSRGFGRVGGIGGRGSVIIRAAFLARGKMIVFIKMRVTAAICPRATRSEPAIGTQHQLPTFGKSSG